MIRNSIFRGFLAAACLSALGACSSGERSDGSDTAANSQLNERNDSGNTGDVLETDAGADDAAKVTHGSFPEKWDDGTACATTPKVQVWQYTPSTYIFRQSLCTNFEGPFLYLLLGQKRALLLDTGTNHADVRTPVETAISAWEKDNGLEPLELIVAHTHSHGDHVAGDSQFRNRPNTVLVGRTPQQVAAAFGFSQWPNGVSTLDLGGRLLDVLPLPGHESAHIAAYDRQEELLITGDTLYPGRLYIQNWSQYRTSIRKLVQFVEEGGANGEALPVRWVLGTHIEMTKTPGQDFPFGAARHPNERELQLTFAHLQELDAAVQAMGSTPRRERHADFYIYP